MSTPVMLTGSLYDLSRVPQADTVTVTPQIPADVEGVVGVAVLDDGLMTPDPVVVAANSQGEFSLLVIPTSQTRAGTSGVGVRYRVSVSPDEYVEVEMPDADSRLVSLVGGSVPGAARDARGVVYSENKDILVAGSNVTLAPDDTARTITINSSGGGGGTADPRIAQNASDISDLEVEAAALAQSIAGEGTQRADGDDIQSVTVSTAASYQSTLNSQQGSANPLLLVIDTAISGTRGGSLSTRLVVVGGRLIPGSARMLRTYLI